MDLLTKLLRLSLSDPDGDGFTLAAQDLPQEAQHWKGLCEEAHIHRLGPLFFHVLSQRGLDGALPEQQHCTLDAAYRTTLRTNMMHWWILGQVLPTLAEQGIAPILFKGMVLSDAYYPDLGTRPMGDIDMLIQPEEYEFVSGVLERAGFHRKAPRAGHASDFRDALGVAIDLHEEFTLFGIEKRTHITESLPITALGGETIRTWEPNAMLMHLIVHLRGHRPRSGLLLGWLMDMAFLVKRRGAELRLDSLEELSPVPEDLTLLWRVLGFLRDECGLAVPACLSGPVASYRPLTLVGIRRDRRLALWRLPRVEGWLGMLACGVGVRKRPTWRFPRISDLTVGLLPGGRD